MRRPATLAPALLALAAGASAVLADFTFQQQCPGNPPSWFGECSTTPCAGGGYNTFNNWGFTNCGGGLPVPGQGTGVGANVHLGSNAVLQNGDVSIGSLDMGAGAVLYMRGSVSTTGQVSNTSGVIVDAGNIGLSGLFVNSGTWTEPNGYNRAFNGATFINNPGATLNWQAANWSLGSGGVLTNNGVISKTTSNAANITVPTTNNGSVTSSEGYINFASTSFASNASASYTIPAALYFTDVTGTGVFNGTCGGIMRLQGGWGQSGNVTMNIANHGVEIANGSFSTGAFTFTNAGFVTNVSGNMSFAGTMNNQGTYYEPNGYNRQFNAFTLNNSGTVELQAANWSQSASGGQYTTSGTTRKTTGNGAYIYLPTSNSGAFSVQAGSITMSGSTMSSVAGASYSVLAGASMYLNDESITGTFNGSNAGLFRVQGGTNLTANTTFNISGNGWEWSGSPLRTNAFTLTNQNQWTWNSGNTEWSGTIINSASATLTETNGYNRQFVTAALTNNGTVNWQAASWSNGTGTNLFTNNASIVKSTTNGAYMYLPVVNNGSVSVQDGSVSFNGSTLQSGATATYPVAAGATLTIVNETIRGTFTGVNNGTARLDGATALSANTTVAFTGNGLLWNGSPLNTGAFTLTNTGGMTWITGNSEINGAIINAATGTMADVSGYNRQFNGATVTNNGTLNLQTGTWTNGTGTNLFTNNSVVNKSTTSSHYLALPVVNNAAINVQAGLLELSNTVRSVAAAAWNVTGGTLRLVNATINGVFNGSSSGSARIDGGLGLSANATLNIGGNGIDWNGSLIDTGAFTLTNAGRMTWVTGNAELRGRLTNTGTISDVSGYNRQFNSFVMTSNGTVDWQSCTWTPTGAANSFTNTGMVTKTTGSGAYINVPMTNSNLVDILAGFVAFNGGLTQTAGVTRLGGGSINGGTINLQGGRLEGNGVAQAAINNTGGVVAPGLPVGGMTLQTNYNPGAGSTFEVDLAGNTPALYDHLQVNGNSTLNGTLRVVYNGAFNPIQGSTFRVLDVSGTRTGTFSNIVYVNRPFASAVTVQYDAHGATLTITQRCGSADFNGDGDIGTDQDIESFFRCLAGNCCPTCEGADFNFDGDTGTDQDIEAFFRVLAGSAC